MIYFTKNRLLTYTYIATLSGVGKHWLDWQLYIGGLLNEIVMSSSDKCVFQSAEFYIT